MSARAYDLMILGGGLAGGLAALAMKREQADLRVALVEAGPRFGGNHLWSFFESDVAADQRALLEPLIGHYWDNYEVRFPAYGRVVEQPYRSIESEALDREVRSALGKDAMANAKAVAITSSGVVFDDGQTVDAKCTVDCRGLSETPEGLNCGWQKFCGQLLSIPEGHSLSRPIVMDATVDQSDGYRFVYCLPFSATELFVEDTYYSETSGLDRNELAQRIAAYASAQGWTVTEVLREETGVLPVVMGGDFDRFWPKGDAVARGGVRAGLFHPLTSYSLPDAVRFAHWLARESRLDETLGEQTRGLSQQHWRSGGFDRMLARMLLRAADPPKRYRVLERFYRLPASLISRFYSGQSTLADRARILIGKPPVPMGRALSAMMGRA